MGLAQGMSGPPMQSALPPEDDWAAGSSAAGAPMAGQNALGTVLGAAGAASTQRWDAFAMQMESLPTQDEL